MSTLRLINVIFLYILCQSLATPENLDKTDLDADLFSLVNSINVVDPLSNDLTKMTYRHKLKMKWNKIMKMVNGNIRRKKTKTHLKVLQINKGNSSYKTKANLIHQILVENQSDVAVIGEANLNRDDKAIRDDNPAYNVEEKVMETCEESRLVVLIKKEIEYERMTSLEFNDISMIWLKIKINRGKFLNLVAMYRQWKLPPSMRNSPDRIGLPAQLDRFGRVCKHINNESSNGTPLLFVGDLNIDQLPENDPLSRYDVKKLDEIFTEMKQITLSEQMNFKPTRFQSGQNPSLLDLFVTNKSNQVTNVETLPSHIADHMIVKLQFHSRSISTNEQFIKIRKWDLINSDNFMSEIKECENLNLIFHSSDPEFIASTIVYEYNRIINKLAPARVVQRRNKDDFCLDQEAAEIKTTANQQLNLAINTKSRDEFRQYNVYRNLLSRAIDRCKKIYMQAKLSNYPTMWKELKSRVGGKCGSCPTDIIDNGQRIKSPKKLSVLFNNFFKDKILTIRSSFKKCNNNAIEVLEKLIKRPDSTFELSEVNIKDVYDIISDMGGTNACGFDDMNSKIIKLVPHITSIYITHLFNTIIRTKTFPQTLKITKLVPILKPQKLSTSKENYRPIANLNVIEKVIEELMKQQMLKYLDQNKIIIENHHGGMKNHSTVTARAVIDFECSQAIDTNRLGVVISTDLSAAFDTVDHGLLIEKMKFYGFSENTIMIFRSYLSDRKQYTELQTRQSDITDAPECSVVQGSKLSGILYTLYTNEVPRLHLLLEDKKWMEQNFKEGITQYDEIRHITVNYVDDSNSIIVFKDPTNANYYIHRYFQTLKIYYNLMKLKINADKTGILVIGRPCLDIYRDDIRIEDGPDIIKPKPQIRILGWYLNFRLSYDTTVNQTVSIVNHRLQKLREISSFMTEKQKIIAVNSYILSKLQYGMPLLIGENENVITTIHRSVMMLARFCKGSFCFKVSINSICNSIGWDGPRQMITKQTAFIMKKILSNHKPKQLFEQVRQPRTRTKAKLGKMFKTQTKTGKKTFLNHGIEVYNCLPDELKEMSVKQFKRKLKKTYIHYIPE